MDDALLTCRTTAARLLLIQIRQRRRRSHRHRALSARMQRVAGKVDAALPEEREDRVLLLKHEGELARS